MATRKSGNRYPLVIYKRLMDRLWSSTLILGLLLGFVWFWAWYGETPLIKIENDFWLLAGAVICLGFAAFAFLCRSVAYVQPRRDHLRLVTPFLRLNISFKRIRSVHPTGFQQLFPPQEASWAQRRFLEPFYPKTAVVVELTSYPMSPLLLRFFLAPQMFSPQAKGFVLVVPNWMDLSTEIDSFLGAWMQIEAHRKTAARRIR